nr:EOG090X0AJZ [Lepidurus arcticus]
MTSVTDKDLKDQGNRLFISRRYDEAIGLYSKAIAKNNTVPQYYSNRALCHLKLKHWSEARKDCCQALDLDPNLVKGHFFLGQALLELDLYDEAIKHLQRAHDVARDQKLNFGDDITSQLRLARKRRFTVQEEKRIAQEIELQVYLNRLIQEDRDRQIEHVREGKDYSEVQDQIADLERKSDNCMAELNSLFAKVDERRQKRDIPDHLCGKISFELLKEPVITPSGITYDRKDIEEHLERVGHFDPITRVKLTQDLLIPNFSMKEVLDAYLAENEWALYY